MLKGFDVSWVEAGNRRTAEYRNLKPGEYTFQVQACNADGIWNTTGDSFRVEFPLHVYQTFWFRASCSGLAILVLIGAYRWIVHRAGAEQRQLQEANDLLEAKVAKRTGELACINETLRGEIEQREKLPTRHSPNSATCSARSLTTSLMVCSSRTRKAGFFSITLPMHAV